MILFGSRARGDAKRGSDYDVAVVVKAMSADERRTVGKTLSNAAYDFVLRGTTIRPVPIDEGFLASASPLAFEIARDGKQIA